MLLPLLGCTDSSLLTREDAQSLSTGITGLIVTPDKQRVSDLDDFEQMFLGRIAIAGIIAILPVLRKLSDTPIAGAGDVQ
ncbi:hypothetical protein C5Y96_21470 [Blastopirellula marina]|uniref:Uncharacterized protein n=1 Tax=Blastopirellula marina TaxID=124 RepID=A0A2S8F1L1_9BACT|nr:hypothetical protein C5Y96_21470 [Blastopirellula marina]RCS44381.1 hypothetical protein DTL36_21515 [Bremerella cremea]